MGMKVISSEKCPNCHEHHSIELPDNIDLAKFKNDYFDFKNKGIKDKSVFKYLSIEQKEILISGFCLEGFKNFYRNY